MKLKELVRPESAGGYSVSASALRCCHSQGETREDDWDNIREAAELWLEVVVETAAAQAATWTCWNGCGDVAVPVSTNEAGRFTRTAD
jgi:predicted RNase H-like HicB family nuclease